MEDSALSKNAYLIIYISHNFLHANLAYRSDKAAKMSFLRDKSFISKELKLLDTSRSGDFWFSYFKNLEKKWKWSLISKPQMTSSGLNVKFEKYKEIGDGVSGCKVCLLKRNPYYKSIFESLRKFCLELKIVAFTKDSERELLEDFTTFVDYDDVLLLDLNSRFLKISRVEKLETKEKANLSRINKPKYDYNSIQKEWDELEDLLGLLNGSKYKVFLSKYVPSNFMSNIWSNFLLNPVFRSNSDLLQDFVRAYITVQLLSLCSENGKVNRDFGAKPKKNLLWLTGDLVEIPNVRELIIAIIDGLQLRGSFDFVTDSNFSLYTFGQSFTLGKKSDEIVFGSGEFLPEFTKVFAPDIDLKPDMRKVVFQGALFGTKDQSSEIFVMSSELTQVEVKDPSTMYLEGRFVRNAYVENYRKLFELRFLKDDIFWNRVVFDCRVKPVVYGPNAKANDIKFKMWLSGEPYT